MKNILIKYKWIIIPLVPLFFFIIMFILLVYPQNNNQALPTPSPENPTTSPSSPIPNNSNIKIREEMEGNVEKRPGLLSKETLPDNTTKYIFTSQNKDRPNVIIARGTEEITFQRAITPPDFPVKISSYTNAYGSAKWIFKGSNFYGRDAQSYIYPDRGFAFIGNTKTGEVLELHTFQPMRVEDYVEKYGEDIPAQP